MCACVVQQVASWVIPKSGRLLVWRNSCNVNPPPHCTVFTPIERLNYNAVSLFVSYVSLSLSVFLCLIHFVSLSLTSLSLSLSFSHSHHPRSSWLDLSPLTTSLSTQASHRPTDHPLKLNPPHTHSPSKDAPGCVLVTSPYRDIELIGNPSTN